MEVYRCPNCGALLEDKHSKKCEYCGAHLVDDVFTKRTDSRFDLHQGEVQYFKNLPDLPITIETTDIPFQPRVIYDNLPGSRVDIKLRDDADEIISLVEKTQRACNEENLQLYTSTLSRKPEDRAFFNKARKGAIEQFMSGDMKRYTVSIDFASLTPELAKIDVLIETIIFMDSGQTNQLEVTFTWSLRNYDGRWFVVNSAPKVPGLSLKGVNKVACIIPLIGLIVGIVGAIIGIIVSVKGCEETTEKIQYEVDKKVETITENEKEAILKEHDITIDEEGNISQKPLVLYGKPDLSEQPQQVIMSPGDYEILKRKGDWVYLRTEDGYTGWTLKVLLERSEQK